MSRVCSFILVAILLVLPALAQDVPRTHGIIVTSAFSEGDVDSSLRRLILDEFRNQLRLRGIDTNGEYQERWYFQVKEADFAGTAQIVLSITRMMQLPEAVVELGADNEAFYLGRSQTDLPPEGKVVRQAMSRDWMANFHSYMGQEILIFERSAMSREISDYLDRLVSV